MTWKMTAGNRALMIAIKEAGPVAIEINANNLQFYESGIIDVLLPPRGARDPVHQPRRARRRVGRGGREGTGCQELYGTDFGEHGYFKLERDTPSADNPGTCGLLFESVYPAVTQVGDPAIDAEAQCSEGSVFKKTTTATRTTTRGSAYASAAAMAEADAAAARRAAAAAAAASSAATSTLKSRTPSSEPRRKTRSERVTSSAGSSSTPARRRRRGEGGVAARRRRGGGGDPSSPSAGGKRRGKKAPSCGESEDDG